MEPFEEYKELIRLFNKQKPKIYSVYFRIESRSFIDNKYKYYRIYITNDLLNENEDILNLESNSKIINNEMQKQTSKDFLKETVLAKIKIKEVNGGNKTGSKNQKLDNDNNINSNKEINDNNYKNKVIKLKKNETNNKEDEENNNNNNSKKKNSKFKIKLLQNLKFCDFFKSNFCCVKTKYKLINTIDNILKEEICIDNILRRLYILEKKTKQFNIYRTIFKLETKSKYEIIEYLISTIVQEKINEDKTRKINKFLIIRKRSPRHPKIIATIIITENFSFGQPR